MNALDKAIASVSPRWAARRAHARVQIATMERIEARMGSRVRHGGGGSSFDQNTGNPNDARPRRLVDRAAILRLAAENPYGKKALNSLVNHSVRWGITGAPKGPKAVATLWKNWIEYSDFRGRRDFYGQEELSVRTMFKEGESFVVRQFKKGPKGIVPLRLQLLDGGMLATEKHGDDIEDGIQYDVDGNVVGYWFHQARSKYRRNRPPVFYRADDVIHLFIEEEIGQKRGRSIYEPVVKRLDDIDDTLDADLVRRKIESCFAGFRTLDWEAADSAMGEREDRGQDMAPLEYFEAGSIATLLPGEDIKFADPKPAGGLGDAVKIQLLATAAGIGVTYEQLTGDLSNVNFSSYRAGALEFDAFIERVQWLTIIPVMLKRVWQWFCEAAFEFGFLNKPSYEIVWTPPPRQTIDRKGDAEADILEMQAGLQNRRRLLNARGEDHDAFVEETAADIAAQQAKGLFFKGDPFTAAQAASSTKTDDGGST